MSFWGSGGPRLTEVSGKHSGLQGLPDTIQSSLDPPVPDVIAARETYGQNLSAFPRYVVIFTSVRPQHLKGQKMDVDQKKAQQIREDNRRLCEENKELRKLVGLMQENMELRMQLGEEGLERNLGQNNKACEQPQGPSDTCSGIICENERLTKENEELRRLVGLMKENLQLRTVLGQASTSIDKCDKTSNANKSCSDTSSQEDIKDTPKHCDSQQIHKMGRIVGEIAFQLDRRILAYIFQDRIRLYGITVSNIPQKIKEATCCRATGQVDEEQKANLKLRYKCIMDKLSHYGYECNVHPGFSEYIVNLFGILKERPQPGSDELKQLLDPENLKKMATATVPENDLKDVLILLKCLTQLSKEDCKPVFVW